MRDPSPSFFSTSATACACLVLAVLVLGAAFAATASPPEVALYDLEGGAVDPFADPGERAVVFLFTRTDCPISNRYAPEIERLYETFGPRGVEFYRVYLDAEEDVEAIRVHGEEFGHRIPALRDPRHLLVAATGATVTLEAAVFEPGGRMVYRGRVDDRWVGLGQARPRPTTHDLRDVLDDIVAGKRLEPKTTTAVGCYISDLR